MKKCVMCQENTHIFESVSYCSNCADIICPFCRIDDLCKDCFVASKKDLFVDAYFFEKYEGVS